jgi:DNA-binding transcriptional MerR regulator
MKKFPEGKVYYSITEIAEQTQVKPHVLRYWESEFPCLSPKKNRAGNRVYQAKDIKMIYLIKQLLYEDGFTIAGAKKKLNRKGALDDSNVISSSDPSGRNLLESIRTDLRNLLKILD